MFVVCERDREDRRRRSWFESVLPPSSSLHIYLTTINNASLSSNTKTRLSSSRTHAQLPDCSCHHWRPTPVKAAITHGNSRDSLSNPEPLSTNCFVYNIYPPTPTNIRSIQSHIPDRYINNDLVKSIVFGTMYMCNCMWQIWALKLYTCTRLELPDNNYFYSSYGRCPEINVLCLISYMSYMYLHT